MSVRLCPELSDSYRGATSGSDLVGVSIALAPDRTAISEIENVRGAGWMLPPPRAATFGDRSPEDKEWFDLTEGLGR